METGIDFNFTYAPGVSLDQMIGFEMAGEFWSQHLADDVSINIFVEMTDYLPENVIGGALPGIEDNVRYEDFRDHLKQDITSGIDSLINYNQQDETDKFTAYFSSQYEENGYKVDNNEYLKMTRANAKALNLIDPHDTELDGYILMRDLDGVGDGDLNSIQWHYDYSDNEIPSDRLDFLSVAIHEVGHTLGFISGLDQANWLAGKRYVNEGNEDDYYSDLVGTLSNATPVDMLRFSQASYQESGDGENWIDMSIGGNPYLSFTGSGGNPVAYFSTGESTDLGGDGYQASHWEQKDNAVGIMVPVLATGQRREITELDLQLFDAIGWDVQAGNINLETINTTAKTELAAKIISTAQEEGIDIRSGAITKWANGNDNKLNYARKQAAILTPDYIDLNNNNKDDRGEQLNQMVENSGNVYNWGWQGYWWGWQGYWWGWQGYWQSGDDLNQDGFWQNLNWQTVEVSNTPKLTTESLESQLPRISIDSNILQPEFEIPEISSDNYFSEFSKFDSRLTTQHKSNNEKGENTIDNQPEVEAIVPRFVASSQIVASESTTLNLDLLGRLLSEKLEDILNVDKES